MTTITSRRIRTVVGTLLILVPIVCLAFVVMFGWGWTDSTTWGAWSKGSQTQSEHLHGFFSFMGRVYWPQILATVAAIVAGIYVLPRKKPVA